MNGLDLFSGIGGITLALSEWVKPIAYCEIDRYAQSVLLSRIADGQLPRAPIWDDITSLNGSMLPSIDIIYGGFPCQDISVAGNGIGLAGERSGLFFHIARLAKETNPRFIFLENVPAIRTRGLNSVIQTLTELGYDCRWTIVSAAEVGAPHLRKRWFLLAHNNGFGLRNGSERCAEGKAETNNFFGNNGQEKSLADSYGMRKQSKQKNRWSSPNRISNCGENVADANGEGLEGSRRCESSLSRFTEISETNNRGQWSVEPDVGRVVNGLSNRVDRIKGLGNSVVPLQARKAFMKLVGINHNNWGLG